MLGFLVPKASDRKQRLFACACARRVWNQLTDARSRAAVEVAERYADAQATGGELQVAGDAVPLGRSADNLARDAADLGCSASLAIECAEATATAGVRKAVAQTRRAARQALAQLLRELVQPFPAGTAINPEWLAWQGGTVVRLAQAACVERFLPEGTLDISRLAVLADALEEAGCADAHILGHLRGPGPHVRGCFVLDLLLAKS
jgi:hypothetical protein